MLLLLTIGYVSNQNIWLWELKQFSLIICQCWLMLFLNALTHNSILSLFMSICKCCFTVSQNYTKYLNCISLKISELTLWLIDFCSNWNAISFVPQCEFYPVSMSHCHVCLGGLPVYCFSHSFLVINFVLLYTPQRVWLTSIFHMHKFELYYRWLHGILL